MINLGKKGLVLTEALLAVAMLAIAVTIVGTIYKNAIATTILSRDYLAAHNLATEAIEAVKDVRNTNWMRKPNDTNCWLRVAVSEGCDKVAMKDNSYTVERDEDLQWFLQEQGDPLELSDGDDGAYALAIKAGVSPFYRSVKFVTADNSSANFEVKVQWRDGAKILKVVRDLTLYNYK